MALSGYLFEIAISCFPLFVSLAHTSPYKSESKIALAYLLPMRDDKINNTRHKHQDRNLIDGVHGAQVKIRLAVRVLFAKEIGCYLR